MTDDKRAGFIVACCGRRRGLLPGGVLVCSRCDYTDGGTYGPPEQQVRDAPEWAVVWTPGFGQP